MAAPRAVKDSDTALWLHNKLGSTEELWVSSSIGGIIKTDTIDNIYRCFPVLTTTVKMKLLLGILHLPRRSLDEMKHTIEGLVELALEDVDQWVRLVANVVKTYPMRGKLNFDLSSSQVAAGVIEQLREKVNDSDVFATLPLECKYVNKNALTTLVGNQPPPVRHFALKRKPKSAALRVDLMQRSSDASNQVKKDGSGFNKTVPVKHRDMTRKLSDASPMRGIPKTPGGGHRADGFRAQSTPGPHLTPGAASRTASRFSSRAERGTKLLDISEQPIGIREQKRRKKQQQEEEAAQQPPTEEKVDETPEYAAGLPQTVSQPVVPDDELPGPSGIDKDSQQHEEEEEEEEEEDEQDVEMEDEEYPPHYSPADSPVKEFNSADQEEPPNPVPQQMKIPSPRKVAPAEKRPSLEELPIYAMPATPSPYFKPVTAPSIITASPARSNPVMLSPNTPSHTSSASSSSSSPSPVRKVVQTAVVPPRMPSNLITQNAQNLVQRQLTITTNPQPAPVHLNPKPPQMPQVPRFYSNPIQNQAGLTSQNNAVAQQSTVRQPVTVLRHPVSMYQPQVQAVVRPTVPYMVSPNIVQLQQLRGQNVRFAPSVSAVAQPGNITVSSNQIFQPQQQCAPQQLSLSAAQTHQLVRAQQQAAAQASAQAQAAQAQQQAQMQKKTLTLTREQMIQAQEMFKTANRLNRQEKAIILGFMAGSRDNPVPDKGDVLQITLSEHEQFMQSASGPIPVVVETFFEMNYRTGATAKRQRVKQFGPQVR